MTAIPAIRLCLGSLALFCSLLLLAGAAPADAAKCSKKGTNGDDVLRGTKKADVLCGRGGNDLLIGKGGKDRLLGDSGDDTLNGGGGADQLKGQGGADTATFASATSVVVVNLTNGTATGQGSDSTSGVENVIGSTLADILTGSDADNVLSGGEGDDLLAGGSGGDVLDGGAGADKANYFTAAASINADLAADTATGQGADSLPAIENVTGSPQDDVLTGDSADNTLHGGLGKDTVSFAAATAGVTVDLVADTATGAGADSLPAIEDVVGSPQGDTVAGDDQDNVIDGAGDADTVSYAASADPVTVDLVNGSALGDGVDDLARVEGTVGSAFADVLIGGDGANELRGGDGNDALAAGADQDLLVGEDGNDQLYGEPEDDTLSGGAGDDLLDGGPGADSCDGGTGTNQFAGGCDTQAPQLDDLSLSPASIDTSGSPQVVTVTLELSDAVTGVDAANSEVSVSAPDGSPRSPASLQLVSGTANDGIFEATVNVPRYAPQGTWTIGLTLADQSGNQASWSSAQLIAGTFPGSFAQTGPGDDAGPQLTDLSIAPASVDTSTSAQDVTFTLDVTDDLAGVDVNGSRLEIASPDGEPKGGGQLELVSGTPTNGTYEVTVTLPRYSPQGTWTASLVLADNAGNEESWSSADLIAATLPGTFEQTGAGDGTVPDLASFSLSPSQVNTTANAQPVTFDLHVTDDLSGLDAALSHVVVTPPGAAPLTSTGLQLVSGTALDGTYQTIISVPQGSPPGTWTVSVVVVDEAGNQREWSSADLVGADFPGSFINVGLDPN